MDALQAPSIPVPLVVDHVAALSAVYELHPPEAQIHWMRSLGAWQLRRLWDLAERANLPLELHDLAPSAAPTVCKGKNHLPVFSWFEKRFARIGDQVVGYNETGWQKTWVGPGHFIVVAAERPGELVIDYRQVPAQTHPDFPALLDNRGLGGWPAPLRGLVYGGLVDRVRRASAHLLIGRSDVKGPSLQAGAYFALHLPPAPPLA